MVYGEIMKISSKQFEEGVRVEEISYAGKFKYRAVIWIGNEMSYYEAMTPEKAKLGLYMELTNDDE